MTMKEARDRVWAAIGAWAEADTNNRWPECEAVDAALDALTAAAPDVAETEPRLTVGQARERLNTQLHCMADEIRAWGTVVDATVDAAIDALIAAVRAEQPAWQSIETAPKDGTRFIAGEHHKLYGWIWGGCRWYADPNVTGGGYFAGDAMRPSHWHPLSDQPSPPSEET